LEREFVDLITRLIPEPGLMRLFKEIVKRVWEQRQVDARALLLSSKRNLQELADRKNRLVDALLDGRIDQSTYDGRVDRLQTEIAEAEAHLRDVDLDNIDIEAVLNFAECLLDAPAQLWLEASLEQKQRLQKVFFPDGVTFSDDGFGTDLSGLLFSVVQPKTEVESNLASPTGFEPVLPP